MASRGRILPGANQVAPGSVQPTGPAASLEGAQRGGETGLEVPELFSAPTTAERAPAITWQPFWCPVKAVAVALGNVLGLRLVLLFCGAAGGDALNRVRKAARQRKAAPAALAAPFASTRCCRAPFQL